MTAPTPGRVFRNIYGAHVVIQGPGEHQGNPVLLVLPCTPDGTVTGDPIPMNPPSGDGGFPGPLWQHVGEVTR